MFDHEAYRRQQLGQNPDKALLTTFRYVYDDKRKEEVPYISIFLGKNDTVDRPATEEDKERFKERWEAFLKGEDKPPAGLPINQVPFATPAEISVCKTEKIYTVEQLLETPDNRLQRAHLLNFRYRCADLMKQLTDSKHVVEMRDEIETLKSQLTAALEKMAEMAEGMDEEEERSSKPAKKRGRKRKTDGDSTSDSEPGTA